MNTEGLDRRQVESCFAREQRALRFPPRIEATFEDYRQRHRARVVASTTIPTLLIYNLLLVADYTLLPATFMLSLICHLMIVTPVILAAALFLSSARPRRLRDTVASLVPLAMATQVLFIYWINANEPAAMHYQYAALGIMVFANINQRLDFRFALGTSVAIMLAHAATLISASDETGLTVLALTFALALAYLSLQANHRMELDGRYTFLRRLHDRLQREQAEEAANHDPLTGLANRYELESKVAKRCDRTQPGLIRLGALMIDVDHFKPFNDHYGHPTGDTCLKRIAGAISAQLRDDRDLAVRYGGEEFLVILHDASLDDAERIGERIRNTIEEFSIPHVHGGEGGVVTASIGASACTYENTSEDSRLPCIESLISTADCALYEAKNNGRNRVCSTAVPDAPVT